MPQADPTDWLLEADNPSVRYFTLVDLLDKPVNDPQVVQARQEILDSSPVVKILGKQSGAGYWGKAEDFYLHSKYKGTVWQLIILAELGVPGEDPRLQKACQFILEYSQDHQSGCFAYQGTAEHGGRRDSIIPCLTGNMVWCLIRFGYMQDPRLQQGIDWITAYQRFDDGNQARPKGWPYEFDKCWGRHTCFMSIVKTLKALAEIPPGMRSTQVVDTIQKGCEYLLQHHIFKHSKDLSRVSKPEWLNFGFPLLWNTDVLEISEILTRLGCCDPRMHEAIDLIQSKRDVQGRWALETTFNGRMSVNIERLEQPSKWITLNALRVLKRWGTINYGQ